MCTGRKVYLYIEFIKPSNSHIITTNPLKRFLGKNDPQDSVVFI